MRYQLGLQIKVLFFNLSSLDSAWPNLVALIIVMMMIVIIVMRQRRRVIIRIIKRLTNA